MVFIMGLFFCSIKELIKKNKIPKSGRAGLSNHYWKSLVAVFAVQVGLNAEIHILLPRGGR